MLVFAEFMIVDEEMTPLTPWPCHQPTQKELADLDEQEKKEENQITDEGTDSEYKMVYSRVHGLVFWDISNTQLSNSHACQGFGTGLLCTYSQSSQGSWSTHE